MKTGELLGIGAAALTLYLLFKKSGEAQTQPLQILGGGGGGGGFDFSSFLAGLNLGQGTTPQFAMPQMPSFNFTLPSTDAFDLSGLFAGLGEILKNLNLGGAGGAGTGGAGTGETDLTDKLNDILAKFAGGLGEEVNPWMKPWQGITAPLKQANINIAATARGGFNVFEALSEVPRTLIGAVKNELTGNVPGGRGVAIAFPGAGLIGGAIREMQQIATEKNPAMQYTVGVGAGIAARYGLKLGQAATDAAVKAAMAEAQAIAAQERLTPQKQAAARELPLGKSPEAPSTSEYKLAAKTRRTGGHEVAYA